MLSNSNDPNDRTRCSAKTVKQNAAKGPTGKYLIAGLSGLPADNFRSEHVFEVHLISRFLEWVCNGKNPKYTLLKVTLDFPAGWKKADATWCLQVFGDGRTGGMQWSRKNGPQKNWIMHTADVLGSASRTDLLVLYHDTPNGRKQKITQGYNTRIKKKLVPADVKEVAESVMVVRQSLSLFTLA